MAKHPADPLDTGDATDVDQDAVFAKMIALAARNGGRTYTPTAHSPISKRRP
jgi:hypothetical protein